MGVDAGYVRCRHKIVHIRYLISWWVLVFRRYCTISYSKISNALRICPSIL